MFPFAALFTAISDIVSKVVPDPIKKAEIMLKVEELRMRPDFAQIEINKVEASSTNVFVSGWRPAVAWVCVAGLFFTYIIGPVLSMWVPVDHMPEFPIEHMTNLVYALLGLGAMRTVEKIKK